MWKRAATDEGAERLPVVQGEWWSSVAGERFVVAAAQLQLGEGYPTTEPSHQAVAHAQLRGTPLAQVCSEGIGRHALPVQPAQCRLHQDPQAFGGAAEVHGVLGPQRVAELMDYLAHLIGAQLQQQATGGRGGGGGGGRLGRKRLAAMGWAAL